MFSVIFHNCLGPSSSLHWETSTAILESVHEKKKDSLPEMLDFSNTGSWLLQKLSFQPLTNWSTDDRLAIGNHASAKLVSLLTSGLKFQFSQAETDVENTQHPPLCRQKRQLPKETAAINSDPKQDSTLLFWWAERQLSSLNLTPKPPSLNKTTVFYCFNHIWVK